MSRKKKGEKLESANMKSYVNADELEFQGRVHPGRRAEQFEIAVADGRVVEGAEDLDRLHPRRAEVGVGVDRADEPEHVLLHIGGFQMHHRGRRTLSVGRRLAVAPPGPC